MSKKNDQTTDQANAAAAGDGVGGTAAQASSQQQQATQDPRAGSGAKETETFRRRPLLIGEPVQYLPHAADAKHVPATITRIEDNGDVSLYVLRSEYNGVEWRDGVKEGKGGGEFRRLEDAMDEARG